MSKRGRLPIRGGGLFYAIDIKILCYEIDFCTGGAVVRRMVLPFLRFLFLSSLFPGLRTFGNSFLVWMDHLILGLIKSQRSTLVHGDLLGVGRGDLDLIYVWTVQIEA